MKRVIFTYIFIAIFLILSPFRTYPKGKVKVVAVNPTYESIAKEIGGDMIEAYHICEWNQDPHFVRGKPSYALLLKDADLFITTGLDLELWAPSIVDKSGNPAIRDGEIGYVSASRGVRLMDIPDSFTREMGDIHIFGNPHIYTSPLNILTVADNIASGLKRVCRQGRGSFTSNLERFKERIFRALFGDELVELMGGKRLASLALSGKLTSFLRENEYGGRKLIERLGGWMKEAEPLMGKEIVCYHKNWIYFADLFGIRIAGYMEPKPGIPPSTRHLLKMVRMMEERGIKMILAANYFDGEKVKISAEKVSAIPVIVPMFVGGGESRDYFELIDLWVEKISLAYEETKEERE